MRLDDGDHPAGRRGAGGLQHGGDLHRMVAVVVDHADAVALAGRGEAALDAARSPRSAWRIFVVLDAELARDGDGGAARSAHCARPAIGRCRLVDQRIGSPSRGRAIATSKRAPSRPIAMSIGADLGLRVDAVGDQAPVGDARRHAPGLRGGRCRPRRSRRTGCSRRSRRKAFLHRVERRRSGPGARGRCW